MISYFNFKCWSSRPIKLPVAFVILKIQRNESWSLCIVSLRALKYAHRSWAAPTIAKLSLCVVSHAFSAGVSDWEYYAIDHFVLLGWYYNSTQSTCTLQASVSGLESSAKDGSAKTWGDINLAWWVCLLRFSPLLNNPKTFGWPFWSFLFKGKAKRAHVGTNC